jgi:mRNA interferase HigB
MILTELIWPWRLTLGYLTKMGKNHETNGYSSPPAVREDFASASFLGPWRTVFNIGGNKYRLVVDMRYDLGRIYIRHVLTHEEYTRRTQEGSL